MIDKQKKGEEFEVSNVERATDPAIINASLPAWAKEVLAKNAELTKKVEMFEEMAGKNAIASYENSKKDKSKKKAKFKIYENEVIVAWSNLKTVDFNPEARRAEDEGLYIDVVTLTQKKLQNVNYVVFNRVNNYVEFDIIETDAERTKLKIPADIKLKYNLATDELIVATKFLNR